MAVQTDPEWADYIGCKYHIVVQDHTEPFIGWIRNVKFKGGNEKITFELEEKKTKADAAGDKADSKKKKKKKPMIVNINPKFIILSYELESKPKEKQESVRFQDPRPCATKPKPSNVGGCTFPRRYQYTLCQDCSVLPQIIKSQANIPGVSIPEKDIAGPHSFSSAAYKSPK
jgi:hypothetical protein